MKTDAVDTQKNLEAVATGYFGVYPEVKCSKEFYKNYLPRLTLDSNKRNAWFPEIVKAIANCEIGVTPNSTECNEKERKKATRKKERNKRGRKIEKRNKERKKQERKKQKERKKERNKKERKIGRKKERKKEREKERNKKEFFLPFPRLDRRCTKSAPGVRCTTLANIHCHVTSGGRGGRGGALSHQL